MIHMQAARVLIISAPFLGNDVFPSITYQSFSRLLWRTKHSGYARCVHVNFNSFEFFKFCDWMFFFHYNAPREGGGKFFFSSRCKKINEVKKVFLWFVVARTYDISFLILQDVVTFVLTVSVDISS